jgi:ferredoxin
MTDLATQLSKFTEADWLAAIDEMLPNIHEVDREAVQIWFRFYPLDLVRHIAASEDREETLRSFALKGDLELKNQIDTSHHFLYGHRYWPTVKRKIEKMASTGSPHKGEEAPACGDGATPSSDISPLVDIIKDVACQTASKLNIERSMTNAIAAIGLATLNQVGIEAFKAAPGDVEKPTGIMSKSPDAIIAQRHKDDSQGILGFLKTIDKKFSVSFSGINSAGKFPVLNAEEIASASQKDRSKPWQEQDERCWEGPVPIECTSASCGTCWVGVLGGREKLSDVAPRERRAMKVFGYNQPDDAKPVLRLACQAQAAGNVTIVIPPWNAVFGKKVRGNVEELELEPATTSARALRAALSTSATDE